ncbi:MAG: biotin--[acetyl-CoA-carboxylase] ligase [Deltaproteobacteria bacterium]|nr:biotin--[acetyl-CoA-carboxylase] ligase [Deltaproteobacteria bacterium]
MSAKDFAAPPAGVPWSLDELRQGSVGNRIGGKFHYFFEIASTNSYARQLADSGAAEGEVVLAESQSHGRGRLGRHWQSPPYVNLYVSLILRPRLAPVDAPQITLMAAVALAETVASFVTQAVTIKWPNDILIGGKKLAGILTEASCDSERLHYVILGIGVNLNYAIATMPEEIRQRATSIAHLTGNTLSRESFLRRLIHDLDRCYGELERAGFAALARRWQSYFSLRDRRVRVELLDQVTNGWARGIDRDGALLVEDDNGVIQRVIAGDVIPVES